MLLKLSEIKLQLRLEDDYTEEDELLTVIGSAVQARTVSFLNRTLYAADADVPDTDPDGLVMTDDIRLGMLLLATHFTKTAHLFQKSKNRDAAVIHRLSAPTGSYRYETSPGANQRDLPAARSG